MSSGATEAARALEPPRRKPIPRGQLLIDGEWCDTQDGATMTSSDPTTEQVITTVAKAGGADLNRACGARSRGVPAVAERRTTKRKGDHP
jgi:acyl-CoA reductase-like NAD-dependent aldehyde dehydrogenase